MAFLRFQCTATKLTTNEVVFSAYLPTWQVSEVLMRGDRKCGLDISWSIVPVYLNTIPAKEHEIDKL